MEKNTRDRSAELIDDGMTVNRVVERFPETLAIFHGHGIDSCCGGALPLRTAAERHGVDLERLLEALRAEAGDEGSIPRPDPGNPGE